MFQNSEDINEAQNTNVKFNNELVQSSELN